MVTAGVIWKALNAINIPVDIREVCVQLAPAFSGLTALATYLFAKEVGNAGSRESTGLWAALFIGIAPGYISRSVAGSYDNEAIAIFILMMTFYLWLRAVKEGSVMWGAVTAMFYFYMVAAWGGYAFITNMLPLHVFVLLLMGRYSSRLYVAYSSFYAIGTLASMQVPFVGFLPLLTSEHMSSLGVFGLLQIVAFVQLVRSHVSPTQFKVLFRGALAASIALGVAALLFMTKSGKIAPWTGRFYSLWDTGYARIHLPLVSSVSEHQPTAWPSFFFDLNFLIYLFPAGVFICFRELRDEHVFVIIYSVLASYFAGVMVRLMLTLTPVVCVTGAMAISSVFQTFLDPVEPSYSEEAAAAAIEDAADTKDAKKTKKAAASKIRRASPGIFGLDTRLVPTLTFTVFALFFVLHSTWVTSTAYSSPSVVLASRNQDGSQNLIDDFREAYYWIRQNTKEDAKIMSWWDYGYQIAGFADRTTLVDNNTWNNTHIAMVGKMMSLPEEKAYPLLLQHDVDYVLVIFGGLIGFSGDDINKFLWMVRISEGIWVSTRTQSVVVNGCALLTVTSLSQPEEITESKYFTDRGEYKVDASAAKAMKDSLMVSSSPCQPRLFPRSHADARFPSQYRLSYNRFAELAGGQGALTDRVRNQQIPPLPPLDYLEEAFTSENWIVRLYKVKPPTLLDVDHPTLNAFNRGEKTKLVKHSPKKDKSRK